VIFQSQVNRAPKFCIFHTPHNNDDNVVADMQGEMIKLGGKGSGGFPPRCFLFGMIKHSVNAMLLTGTKLARIS
jgi:hypothetical protein